MKVANQNTHGFYFLNPPPSFIPTILIFKKFSNPSSIIRHSKSCYVSKEYGNRELKTLMVIEAMDT